MQKWTTQEIKILEEKYPRESQKELTKLLNRSWTSIKAKARMLKIKKDRSLMFREQHGITLNEDYFKNWTNNMAYILGFITADGCVKGNRLNFTLNNQDTELLYKFAEEFGKGINISFIGKKKNCYLAISSPIIIKDLKDLGIVERKTFIVKPPSKLPEEYLKDYIRGYLDGDGCVCFSKNRLRTDFRCNEYIGQFLKEKINKLVNSKTNLVKTETKNGIIYSLQYWDNKANILLKWIYSNTNDSDYIYLNRKFDKYNEYIEFKNARKELFETRVE